MSASSSFRIPPRSRRARPTWCARWSATRCRSPGRGGNPDGGLGTNVAAILAAIETAWSPAGVAILVDLGGAETNSEMAVEMLPEDRRARVVVCNAPIVEGAVMAATEASGGSPLAAVKRSAEEFYA